MTSDDIALRRHYAARFQDQSVVERYHLRPAYPHGVFTLLQSLIVDEPRAVLDVGCGPGPITLGLVEVAERIDAVDLSPQMLALAQSLPGGTSPKIRWLLGKAEEIELAPPYALITAGRSLHWLDWSIALPRFAHLLTANGVLAIVQTHEQHTPWEQELRDLLRRYAGYVGSGHRDMISQLEEARLFQRLGENTTTPMVQQLSPDEYIARQHSRSACSLDEMPAEQAAQFDAEAQTLLAPYADEGVLSIEIVGIVVWGKPLTGTEK